MKLVAGSILLLAAEQAYAQAHLIQFPNHDIASGVLIPAAWAGGVGGVGVCVGAVDRNGWQQRGKCGRPSVDKG